MTSAFSWQNSISLCPASLCTPKLNLPVTPDGLPWKQTEIILSFLRLHTSTAFWTLVDYDGYSISSKGFLPTVVDIMVI